MDMNQLLKQAQQMQAQMAQAQEQLSSERVESSAGGGAVTVQADGTGHVLKVTIDPEAVDVDDIEMLEDLVLAAVNEAQRMASDLAEQRLGAVTGGMGMPGGMPGLPGF